MLFLGAAILIVLQVMWLDEPWDDSHAGYNSGTFCAYSCRGFERHGYFDVGGIPSITHHANGGDFYTRYVNHPPTLYFLLYPCYLIFGSQEASIHGAMLIVLIFTLILMRLFLAPIYGPRLASLATLIFAALPMTVQFMRMADPIIFCLPFLVPTACLWFRYLKAPSAKSLTAYFVMGFAAGMMDWHVYFVVVALWIDLLFCSERSLKRFFFVGFPFGVSLIVVLMWIALSSANTIGEIGETLMMTKTAITGGIETFGPSPIPETADVVPYWFSRVSSHFQDLITIPVLIVSALGFLVLLARRRLLRTEVRFTVVLLVAGAIPFAAAHEHAFVHEFWPIMLSPAFAVLCAVLANQIYGWRNTSHVRRSLGYGAILALTGYCFYVGIQYHDGKRQEHPRAVMVELNERFEADDLVFSASRFTSQRFYADFTVMSSVFHPVIYRRALGNVYSARGEFKKLYIFWPKDAKHDFRWLQEGALSGEYVVNFGYREVFDGVESSILDMNFEKAFALVADDF
ncbi:MAG: hypothetical protein ACI97A_001450 [Planctomycetota bacterium]